MIIFKYLTKEVLSTLLATTFVLMLIFLSTQFVHYLSEAAFQGRFSGSVVLHIMVLQVPYLLGLLLPLGFYLAVLTAYGRLHADREMLVLHSCGFSEQKLLQYSLSMAVVVALIVAVFTCWLAPYVTKAQKEVIAKAQSEPLVETIMPGRFYSLQNGRQVFYIQSISRDHKQLKDIFVATQTEKNQQAGIDEWSTISAENGYQFEKNGHELVITDGNRYDGTPGNNQFQIQHFSKLSWLLPEEAVNYNNEADILPLSTLINAGMQNPQNAAELQWRFSIPLSVFLLTLLALPLSKVNPRQGKFAQFLPAVLIYIFYANMMFVGRSWIKSGVISPNIGLWWLHFLLLMLAVGLMFFRSKLAPAVWKKLFKGKS